jgi:nucleotide-binding universal stress UspA family protein
MLTPRAAKAPRQESTTMTVFNRILVPVDFSPCANEATRHAADLAGRYDATLCLVHVYDPPAHWMPSDMFPSQAQIEQLINGHRAQLEQAKKDIEVGGARKVEAQLLRGVAASEIVEQAKRWPADLIVMGTHGRTGLEHALVGSVAERVVRRAPCPVLVVPAR